MCRRCPARRDTTQHARGRGAVTQSEGSATAHSVCSSKVSSTRHIHTPRGELPCPKGCPHHRTDDDTQARNIACDKIKTHSKACAHAAGNHHSTQQSKQATLVPSAFLSASSGTFNSLFKVLFIFPSWYLFAIGFEPIFSLR